jgi:YHS domain-containing protein
MKLSFTFLKIFFPALLCLLITTAACFATEEVEKTATAAPYPLSICVVSGDKLGVMGAPVIVQHDGTEVRFCCKDCVKDFDKDPEKYLKRLHAAPATQSTTSVPPKI